MSLEQYDLNTTIYYKDISDSKEEFLSAKENLDIILRYAPSGSHCKLKVLAVSDGFEGVLEVSSQERLFRIKHKDLSIQELQNTLFLQMNKNLNQWKENRSVEDITGIVKLNNLKS